MCFINMCENTKKYFCGKKRVCHEFIVPQILYQLNLNLCYIIDTLYSSLFLMYEMFFYPILMRNKLNKINIFKFFSILQMKICSLVWFISAELMRQCMKEKQKY